MSHLLTYLSIYLIARLDLSSTSVSVVVIHMMSVCGDLIATRRSESIYTGLRHKNIKVMLVNPAFVNTPLVSESAFADKIDFGKVITPEDVAEVCLLPFRLSKACVPSEVTLRLTLSAFK